MKFLKATVLSAFALVALVGCTETEFEQEIREGQEVSDEEVKENNDDFDSYEVELVNNNKTVDVKLVDLKKIEEDIFEWEEYQATFEVQNNYEKEVAISVVSIANGDMMVDDYYYNMYVDVPSGKKAQTKLNFEAQEDGQAIIDFEQGLEIELEVYDDSYDEKFENIKVDLKFK